MHIFPYSKRKGTMAYNFPVPNGNIVKARIKKLEEIRTQLCNSYFQLITGKIFELLVEEKEDEYLISKLLFTIKKIAKEQGFAEDGYRVISNCGTNGAQEVPHLHFHLLAGKQLGEKIV